MTWPRLARRPKPPSLRAPRGSADAGPAPAERPVQTQRGPVMNAFAAPALTPRLLDPSLAGKILLPSDHGFDEARRAWNLAVDQRPAAVVFPESAAEVAAAVRYAAGRGLRIAAQGTGHGAGSLG